MKQRFTTSIALDEETSEIAERMPNLSHFVREQLRAEAARWGQGRHIQAPEARINGKCNGMHKILCGVCWPEGRPDRDGWIAFTRGGPVPTASYQQSLKHFAQLARAGDVTEQEGGKTISNDTYKRKGVFFRLLTLIRGG